MDRGNTTSAPGCSLGLPERLGNYRVLEIIGAGGMGQVIRVRHIEEGWARRQGGDVAMKLVHPEYANDPDFRERFYREAELGRRIRHPHVAQVHEVVSDGPWLGAVLDLIEGTDLSARLRPESLPLDEVLTLLRPLAEVLDYLHAQGIVHRDVKPANVRVRPDGSPVLLDLGIAKDLTDPADGQTKTMTMLGTTAWMAPEQADGKTATAAADIYAFGLVAYRMLSGQMPWDENVTEARIITNKMVGRLQPLATAAPGLPSGVARAIMAALSVEVENRPATCGALVEQLAAPASDWETYPSLAGLLREVEKYGLCADGASEVSGDQIALLRPLAEAGEPRAQACLGWCLHHGLGVVVALVESVAWLQRAAEAGLAVAQYMLGDCYAKGHGAELDELLAFEWYERAARQKCARAQHALGLCFEYGEGVAEDPVKAARWYRQAAKAGLPDAQYKLGWALYLGEGIARDLAASAKWLQLAADAGNANAQHGLGLRYHFGDDVIAPDLKASVDWFRRAAEQGHSQGQEYLGLCLLRGTGVPADPPAGLRMLESAAEQGSASAQFALGQCLESGFGTARDSHTARRWYQAAALQGHPEATQRLEDLTP